MVRVPFLRGEEVWDVVRGLLLSFPADARFSMGGDSRMSSSSTAATDTASSAGRMTFQDSGMRSRPSSCGSKSSEAAPQARVAGLEEPDARG